MTDDEIALWLITKGTMEDKPTMALAADRILTLRAERDRLRLYVGHDDDCTVNRYPSAGACSCGLRAAFPAVQPDPVPYSRRSPMEHEYDVGDEG